MQERRMDDGGRYVRTAGAFGKRRPGRNTRGDTSTRDALARLLKDGEDVLRDSVDKLSPGIETVWEFDEKLGRRVEKTEPIPVLPHNWGGAQLVHSIDGGQPWHGWYSLKSELFEEAARRGGWMKAMGQLIAEHSGFFGRMFKKIISCPHRGMNSPYNEGSWGIIHFLTGQNVKRWHTPGRAFRAISHGIRRAKEILSGFNITTVPWTVVVKELEATKGPKRGSKLGQRLALRTLAHFSGIQLPSWRVTWFTLFRGFRHDEWRKMSPEVREYYKMEMGIGIPFHMVIVPLTRVDDGVKFLVLRETLVRQHQVFEGYTSITITLRSGRQICRGLRKQTLVVSGSGRTFHLPWWPSEIDGVVSIESNNYQTWGDGGNYNFGCFSHNSVYSTVPQGHMAVPEGHENAGQRIVGTIRYWQRFAVRFAQRAWVEQKATLRAEGLEIPEGISVLAFREDSYRAGNCSAGTEAFLSSMGWSKRNFVPVDWLLQSSEPRAHATAKAALKRFWSEPDRRISIRS